MGRAITLFVIGFVAVFAFTFYWSSNLESISESIGMGWWLAIFIGVLLVMPLAIVMAIRRSAGKTVSFMGTGKRTRQIQGEGTPATATVLSIGEINPGRSIMVNNQPYLRLVLQIDGAGSAPYESTVDTIIPHYALARFQPGAMFAVRVDPNDPQVVVLAPDDDVSAVAGTGSMTEAGTMPMIVAEGWSQTDLIKLERDGKQGIARVVSAAATGQFDGEKPIEQIDFEVLLPREDPYTVTKQIGLPASIIPQIESTIGKSYPVTVHPEDRQKVSVAFTF